MHNIIICFLFTSYDGGPLGGGGQMGQKYSQYNGPTIQWAEDLYYTHKNYKLLSHEFFLKWF